MRYTQVPSHRFNSLRSQVVFFFFFFSKTFIPNPSVSPPRPRVQRRETPKKPFSFVFREPREVRARSRRHTHGPERHSMNTNEAVASESCGGGMPHKKSRRVPSWLHPARGVPRWPDPAQNPVQFRSVRSWLHPVPGSTAVAQSHTNHIVQSHGCRIP